MIKILEQTLSILFLIIGWLATAVGLIAWAVLGTLALLNTCASNGWDADPAMAGPMMITLFVIGFMGLDEIAGGAMLDALWWSDDDQKN